MLKDIADIFFCYIISLHYLYYIVTVISSSYIIMYLLYYHVSICKYMNKHWNLAQKIEESLYCCGKRKNYFPR